MNDPLKKKIIVNGINGRFNSVQHAKIASVYLSTTFLAGIPLIMASKRTIEENVSLIAQF